jgi:O-glycosyl hydrolase
LGQYIGVSCSSGAYAFVISCHPELDSSVVQMDQVASAFDGIAFHCYAGTVRQQDDFNSKYPRKEIYLTECASTIGSDWWSDIKWYMDNLFIGSIGHNSHVAMMWNIAGDSDGGAKLPGTSSCSSGCCPIVTIYNLNQECTFCSAIPSLFLT